MNRIRPTVSVLLAILAAPTVIMFTGCMQPVTTPKTAATAKPKFDAPVEEGPIESNIVRVNKFFSSDPWLSFNADGTSRVDGVRFSVYLEGAGRPQGVFGTGRIVVTMYGLHHDGLGHETATQLYEWDMSSDQAYPWRSKEKTALGWGYGMRLQWDDKIDVNGKQIAFVVKYIREDGKVITSSRQVLKPPGSDPVLLTRAAGPQDPPKKESVARPRKSLRSAKPAPLK